MGAANNLTALKKKLNWRSKEQHCNRWASLVICLFERARPLHIYTYIPFIYIKHMMSSHPKNLHNGRQCTVSTIYIVHNRLNKLVYNCTHPDKLLTLVGGT